MLEFIAIVITIVLEGYFFAKFVLALGDVMLM